MDYKHPSKSVHDQSSMDNFKGNPDAQLSTQWMQGTQGGSHGIYPSQTDNEIAAYTMNYSHDPNRGFAPVANLIQFERPEYTIAKPESNNHINAVYPVTAINAMNNNNTVPQVNHDYNSNFMQSLEPIYNQEMNPSHSGFAAPGVSPVKPVLDSMKPRSNLKAESTSDQFNRQVPGMQFSPRGFVQPGITGHNVKHSPRSTALERNKLAARKSKLGRIGTKTGEKQATIVTGSSNPEQSDPFTQWYQMMSQYYNQFYPGYQLPQPPGMPATNETSTDDGTGEPQSLRNIPTPLKHDSTLYNQQQTRQANPMGLQPGGTITQPGSFDYASYYYQYYYGMANSQFWPQNFPYPAMDVAGRQTPKLFPSPHVRAVLSVPGILLQILPTRPTDGELARVEFVDIGELANEAVAEATKRATETSTTSAKLARYVADHLNIDNREQHGDSYSSGGASGLDSPAHLSSYQADDGTDGGEEARGRVAIAVAWDRADHVLYPGPLNRSGTLKADVLAFLREKLAEIQDRLPIDWESAGLLIAYLEALIKNNGNVQPSDLVNLLLEGHAPQTSELRTRGGNAILPANCTPTSYVGVSPNQNLIQRGRSYLTDSLASLSPSQPPSGRQSPQNAYAMVGPTMMSGGQSIARAASETGGLLNTQAFLRKTMAGSWMTDRPSSEAYDQVLDRFRELLMHGLTTKALEHACRSQLWGHAFVLANRLGPPVFDKVMDRFLTRAIPSADPIITLYQLTAGEMPQAVTQAAYGRGTDNGDWRPHLAMILAADSAQPELALRALERLGDSLLSRHLIYAAQLCYLLMGPLCHRHKKTGQSVYHLPDKIWLLGVGTTDPALGGETTGAAFSKTPRRCVLTASTEAIQLTEVYEFAMKLANRDYRLHQLLPFKLVYATRLIDAGLLDKANRYLTAIGTDLLLEAVDMEAESSSKTQSTQVPPVLYSLVANCLRLADPLQCHPELDGFDMTLGPDSPRLHMGNRSSMLGHRRQAAHRSFGTMNGSNWIDQLRELYQRMNRQMGRCGFQVIPPSHHDTELTNQSSLLQMKLEEPHNPSMPTLSDPAQLMPTSLVPTAAAAATIPVTSATTSPGQWDSSVSTTSGPPVSAHPFPGQPINMPHQGQRLPTPVAHGQPSLFGTRSSADPSSWTSSPQGRQPMPTSGVAMAPVNQPPRETRPHRESETPTNFHPMHYDSTRPRAEAPPSGESMLSIPTVNSMDMGSMHPHEPRNQPIALASPSLQYSHSSQLAHTPIAPEPPYLAPSRSECLSTLSGGGGGSALDAATHNPPQPLSMQPESMTPRAGAPGGNFFAPAPFMPTATTTSQVDGSDAQQPVFDYFAMSQYQTGGRSRTASGGSQSSLSGAPTTPSRHTPFSVPGVRTRTNSGGSSQPRRDPAGASKQLNEMGDLQRRPIEETEEETAVRQSDGGDSHGGGGGGGGGGTTGNNLTNPKDGWFSGLLGKLRRTDQKSVHLPDDSKPSIVWDDTRKQWIDVNNPESQNPTPPPPPPPSTGGGGGGGHMDPPSSGMVRVGSRSRYVNVLANQTSGSAASQLADAPLRPPLPPAAFSIGGAPAMNHHERLSNDNNLRPLPQANHPGPGNTGGATAQGPPNSSVMMYQ